MKIVEVAAGLVFRNHQLLITQRHAAAHLGGKWEFPGGKRESGESYPECLIRELREELGIEVQVGPLLQSITHRYPEKTVRLEFYKCRLAKHEPQAIGCPAFAWVGRADLAQYAFPEADSQLLCLLHDSPEIWD